MKTPTEAALVAAYRELFIDEPFSAKARTSIVEWLERYRTEPQAAIGVGNNWCGKNTRALFKALGIKQPRTKAAMFTALADEPIGRAPEEHGPLRPSIKLLSQLGSIARHAEEMLSSDGHAFDKISLAQNLNDPDVQQWLKDMGPLVPVLRKP